MRTHIYFSDRGFQRIRTCFTQFALQNIAIGRGIIIGADIQELASKINSPDPCLSNYPSALKEVDYLAKLNNYLPKKANKESNTS